MFSLRNVAFFLFVFASMAGCGGSAADSASGIDAGAYDVTFDGVRPLDARWLDVIPGDGCGLVTCASAHATCGGGGTPSVCGHGGMPDGGTGCVPRTCAAARANCGPVADGCGGALDCGTCSGLDTCGGGGVPSVCGHGGSPDGGAGCTR